MESRTLTANAQVALGQIFELSKEESDAIAARSRSNAEKTSSALKTTKASQGNKKEKILNDAFTAVMVRPTLYPCI